MSRSLLGGLEHQITHANVDIELNGVFDVCYASNLEGAAAIHSYVRLSISVA